MPGLLEYQKIKLVSPVMPSISLIDIGGAKVAKNIMHRRSATSSTPTWPAPITVEWNGTFYFYFDSLLSGCHFKSKSSNMVISKMCLKREFLTLQKQVSVEYLTACCIIIKTIPYWICSDSVYGMPFAHLSRCARRENQDGRKENQALEIVSLSLKLGSLSHHFGSPSQILNKCANGMPYM